MRAINVLNNCFAPFLFYKNEELDSADLNDSHDTDRILLAKMVQQQIADQTWPCGPNEPTQDELLLSALEIIYGGKYARSH